MKTIRILFSATLLLTLSLTLFAVSITDSRNDYSRMDQKNLEKAITTLLNSEIALDNIMEDPTNCIPPALFNQSEGIVIFPNAFKLALGIAGGQGGRGIAMIHKEDGSWSNPFFVTLGEGSVGLQIGAQASDIVLLFKDKNDIMELDNAEIALGSDIGVTAGPVSKDFSATTNIEFDSEIYSYGCSKGLFAGISVKGGVLTMNKRVNESLYRMVDLNAEDIIYGIETPYIDEVNDLIEALDLYGD